MVRKVICRLQEGRELSHLVFLVLDPAGNTEHFTDEMSQTKLKVMLAIPTV